MHTFTCPGLPASWVNAWLAAIGATVLSPHIRLHWTADDAPVAVLSSVELDPVEALVDAWPDEALLQSMPVAENLPGAGVLERRGVTVKQFAERAGAARGRPLAWTLSSTMTDLSIDDNGEVAHAPFDPPAPNRVARWHSRLLRTHKELAGAISEERLRASLLGEGTRVEGIGLGFDITRLGSLADASKPWVEPVVELLAFFGLALFPMRGHGADRRLGRRSATDEQRQRGWRRTPGGNAGRRFVWPAWQQPLGATGVDALLDAWNPWRRQAWPTLGVHAAWQTVRYDSRAQSDPTRAFGSEAL